MESVILTGLLISGYFANKCNDNNDNNNKQNKK